MDQNDETQNITKCVCTLKWFNESKGFGFLVPEDNDSGLAGKDAFVHVSAFQELSIQSLGCNARVSCEISQTEKGLFVERVTALLCPGDEEEQKIKIPLPPEVGETYDMKGVVKWYRSDKEYGFVAGEDGKKDIFIHQTVLKRNQINDDALEKGTLVMMSVRDVDQGREAVEIEIICPSERDDDDDSEEIFC